MIRVMMLVLRISGEDGPLMMELTGRADLPVVLGTVMRNLKYVDLLPSVFGEKPTKFHPMLLRLEVGITRIENPRSPISAAPMRAMIPPRHHTQGPNWGMPCQTCGVENAVHWSLSATGPEYMHTPAVLKRLLPGKARWYAFLIFLSVALSCNASERLCLHPVRLSASSSIESKSQIRPATLLCDSGL